MNEQQKNKGTDKSAVEMPDLEIIQEELSKAESMDDFFGREGIFARLFAGTLA
jgi:hypothetical protein